MNRDLNTRIIDITVGELLDLIKRTEQPAQPKDFTPTSGKEYVYGLAGIAKLLGCSKQHAMRLKASGKLDEAIKQDGRIIVTDARKALELFGKKKK
jgi:hypothetical protein